MPGWVHAATRQQPADIEATAEYLIAAVARSDHTFVRNSAHYTGSEATDHLRRKYAHFRDRIESIDDFIELAASRSLMTGKPYLVIDSAGHSRPVSQWLRQLLSEHCARPDDGPEIPCSD